MLEERGAVYWRVEIVEPIRSPHIAPTEVAVPIAVNLIGTGLCDDVQHHVAGLPVLGVVIIGENLKLLDFFDGGAESVTRGDQLIRNVPAVEVHGNTARVGGSRAHDIGGVAGIVVSHAGGGGGQSLIVISDATNPKVRRSGRQVGNLLFVNHRRHV